MGVKNTEEYRRMLTDMFTDLVNDSLDHPVTWHQGWTSALGNRPYNALRKNEYRGINRFYLALVAYREGFKDPRWATMNQIKQAGWHLQKGSKGYQVEYWFPYDFASRRSLTWTEYRNKTVNGDDMGDIMIRPRYFYVFNASNIDGVPALTVREMYVVKPDELIDKLSAGMNVPIKYTVDGKCAYDPYHDRIQAPPPGAFENSYEYNSSMLHELAHATGHEDRLGRDLSIQYGSPGYAREELVAEITSAFMGAHLIMPEEEVPDTAQHREYVRGWLQNLKNDPDMLVSAVKDAEKASAYMEYKAGIIDLEKYLGTASMSREITMIEEPVVTVSNVQSHTQHAVIV